jgi:hypothetical protein
MLFRYLAVPISTHVRNYLKEIIKTVNEVNDCYVKVFKFKRAKLNFGLYRNPHLISTWFNFPLTGAKASYEEGFKSTQAWGAHAP